jgi:hypothetical protein
MTSSQISASKAPVWDSSTGMSSLELQRRSERGKELIVLRSSLAEFVLSNCYSGMIIAGVMYFGKERDNEKERNSSSRSSSHSCRLNI